MPEPLLPLTEPRFDSMFLELAPAAAATGVAAAQAALAGALQGLELGSVESWQVEEIREAPGTFDLIPAHPQEIGNQQAWQLYYELRKQSGVRDAEPTFNVLQDNLPQHPGEIPVDEAISTPAAGLSPSNPDDPFDWSPTLIRAQEAWSVSPRAAAGGFAAGKSKGEGILIGHPDSGFRHHNELFGRRTGEPLRFREDLGFDFIRNLPIQESVEGGHGLGTSSVLMSREELGVITGVAPRAEIIPYRVAEARLFPPTPVLLSSGMRRLRQAIEHAVFDRGCHVISISLGWLPSRPVHDLIRKVVKERNVIVVAAAGNLVPFVVWPAHYSEVIAVAGCTATREPWSGSSSGPRVAVSGPAKNVWKASFAGGGAQTVVQSDGTSFATPSTAAIAALWLAHWGRDFLLDFYQGQFSLANVFKRVLMRSCRPWPAGVTGYGRGIVDAKAALDLALPTLAEMAQDPPVVEEEILFLAPAPEGFGVIAEGFDNVPRETLRSRLARLAETTEDEVESRLDPVGRETLFHLLTNPDLRGEVAQPVGPVEEGAVLNDFEAPAAPTRTLREVSNLSPTLRARLG